MDYSIPIDEQETVINLFPAQVSRTAEIYSCIPTTVRRLKELAVKRPDVVRIVSEDGYGMTAEVDRSCVKIAPKRQLSEEQRRKATERLASARAKKEGST